MPERPEPSDSSASSASPEGREPDTGPGGPADAADGADGADASFRTASTAEPAHREIVDPDVDLHIFGQRREFRDAPWSVLAAVALGGAFGGAARSALGLALPHAAGGVPWATLTANVSGCLLIGVLMTAVAHLSADTGPSRLLRPFAGVGLIGGYTTFSAHVGDVRDLLESGAPAAALGYIAATLLGGLAAVWAGVALTERLLDHRQAHGRASAPSGGRGGSRGNAEVAS
ncbi:fluoride efflux transporter FluC [Streptomonospora wellingtoniae]|uniref:Fluoride-specific ion channel FluC n=1 Tax=Streptomonospora wellingtoniae TaxID=3075544 RepID=A0ABU2KZ55_9ACTN|nr:CrcB family protein [Streptomonospora sp. DSM 45055]MDT0304432.1 CrcB family protein [Streptomonospora sp. DSM 45055]